jgi:nucleoid DNA-binding protein
MRQDVPAVAKSEEAVLENDPQVGFPLRFHKGPVKQTSHLIRIAVCGEGVSREEQEKRVREATAYLAEEFVNINRTCFEFTASLPKKFNMENMASYVAAKNSISRKQAKQIIDDFLDTVEKGVLTGNRVPLGPLGKIHLRKRSMRRARVGRNPSTGEEITIPAQPERMAPSFSFSKHLKEEAEVIDPETCL